MSTQYLFITKWQLRAPREAVWQAIYDSLDWPVWWKGVVSVSEQVKGDAAGIGSVRLYTWKSVLPYKLSFLMRLTDINNLQWLRGEAFGELEGRGEWIFSETAGITSVQYNWTVVTNKPWMNWCSFLLKPLFRYNHDVVMRWGAEGLARKLSAELVSY